MRLNPPTKDARNSAQPGGTSTEAVIKEEGAVVNAAQMGDLRDPTGLVDDRVDGQREKCWAKRISC